MFEQTLRQAFAAMAIPCTRSQAALCARYFALLIEANHQMNLTNVTEEQEAVFLHFCDSASLLPLFSVPENARCLDVGTGAGFPGMVLAILRPDLSFTLMDSLQKRVGFLQRVTDALSLPNVRCVHARAEQSGHDPLHREQYDLVVSRAVANLRVLAEYCLPFVRPGGRFVAYKGPQAEAECGEAKAALARLGGKLCAVVDARVPAREHRLVFVEKARRTPNAYPRKAGTPAKEPL